MPHLAGPAAVSPDPVAVAASIVSIDPAFYIFTPASRQDGVPSLKDTPGSEDTVNSFLHDDAPPDGRAPSFVACVFPERGGLADARRYQGLRGRPRHFSALAPCCPLRF